MSAAAPAPGRHWLQFTGADVVFVVLCLLIFPAAKGKMLSDPGLGWHLRNIDAMIAAGGWLTSDPFTQTRDGVVQPWRTNQWLGELPFWLGERWAGLEGIAAVATIVLAFMLRSLYTALLRDGLPWQLAAAWVCVAAVGTNCSWIARPNLFTMLFVFVTARQCEHFHTGRISWRTLLWLLPLFTVWANMHGGFIAGFLLLVPATCVEAFLGVFYRPVEKRQAARRRGLILLALTGGCFLATLINPYGIHLYEWVFKLLGNKYFMTLHEEWKPPPMTNIGALQYVPLFVLFPLVVILSRRRPNLLEIALAGGWMYLAMTGFRYLPLWVLIAVPVMARVSMGIPWVAAFVDRHLVSGNSPGLTVRGRGRVAAGIWSVVAAGVLVAGSRLIEDQFAGLLPEVVDAKALDTAIKLHDEAPEAVVFHSYNWGGYLTWRGWRPQPPRLLNWIDDRNEVQGEQHVRATFAILDAEPGWEETLDQAPVRIVCIERDAPLAKELAGRAEKWEQRYEDDYAVIFVRRKVPVR